MRLGVTRASCITMAVMALSGCMASDEVKMVQAGHLEACPNHTVEQMVDSFLGAPAWESGTTDGGQGFVNVSGDMTLHDKPVQAVIQFAVDKQNGRFEFNAFETNGVPQPNFMAIALLVKMCESVGT